MKNKHSITRWLLAAVLPALFLTACSKDNDATDYPVTLGPSGGDIRFEIGFAPQGGGTMNASTDGSDVPLTRVATDALFNSTWEDGDEIGVFAVKAGEPLAASGNYIHNAKLTYSSATGTWVQAEPLYWPTKAENITALDFYAYYPYDANAANPTAIAFSVKADQSGTTDGKSNHSLSDLLTAKAAGVSKGTEEKVPLTFSHALAMVQVAIPGGKGWGGGSEGLTVTLRGMKPGATLNLGDMNTDAPGSGISVPTTGNNAAGITMYRIAEPTDGNYLYRALVPAQSVAQGQSLFFFDNEGRQLFTDGALSSPLAMTAGQAEKFTRSLPAPVIATVKIPAGKFNMGSPEGELYRESDEKQHEVTLTKDFYMSKYEITNAQFAAFLNNQRIGENGEGNVSSEGTKKLIFNSSTEINHWGVTWDGMKWVPEEGYANHPVIYVTWYGAKAYADWAGGALPTEAQWEYACRAGTKTPWSFGGTADDIGDYAWFIVNSGGTRPVGTRLPNRWGLYDMHGNVDELCADWYDENYYNQNINWTDPTGPGSSVNGVRVRRGGAWNDLPKYCRSALRRVHAPANASFDNGFRIVFNQ